MTNNHTPTIMTDNEYNKGLKDGYAKSLAIVENLSKNIEPPETSGKLDEIPYHEQYIAYQAQTEILARVHYFITKHAPLNDYA